MGGTWTGFIWLRIRSSDGLLYTKNEPAGNFLTSWITVSFSRRAVFQVISSRCKCKILPC
jgi:hypothetical protein